MNKKNKKKILIHSNYSRAKTGFGKHMKNLISYLYKTNKYDIVELSNGRRTGDPDLQSLPWKAIGSLPTDPQLISEINNDKAKQRLAAYGVYGIDEAIKTEKPDVYLGIEDIWGFDEILKKEWWSKINSIIWTPIDSLPLLDKHIHGSKKTKNIIVQASFAHNALKDLSLNNSHLIPVPIDTSSFHRLNDDHRLKLRSKYRIGEKDFIIGFVFRNQLRKSVPNLLDGYKDFIESNPDSNAKLLFHTHWSEGWDIPRLLREKNIDSSKVLTTYFCDKCNQYEIKPFTGQDLNCGFCGSEKSQQTSQINRGVSESQLNEIYNLMDVYCHPFTSGGQEIPIQEAKLTELITLVTNYSCGEDYCTQESGGLPLDWSEYREPGTQFIKASTSKSSISDQLSSVYNMPPKEKKIMGKRAREFVIDFCSIESSCSKFCEIIDNIEDHSWDFDFSRKENNIKYVPEEIKDPKLWLIDLYKNVFNKNFPEIDNIKEINHFLKELNSGKSRQDVYNHIIREAIKENSQHLTKHFSELLDGKKENRILFCLPGNNIDVFNSTSILRYIKEKHQNHDIYYATKAENFPILNGNPYIYKVIGYSDVMDNPLWAEGNSSHEGFFDMSFSPSLRGYDSFKYVHGNKHEIDYNINYA